MPVYEYRAIRHGCDYCEPGFEYLQRLDEEPLTVCPHCGEACEKILSGFAVNKTSRNLLSPANLEKHGFTQYQRGKDGQYEKTAGVGPKIIHKG
jgi:putative FmdB family regulatory protein